MIYFFENSSIIQIIIIKAWTVEIFLQNLQYLLLIKMHSQELIKQIKTDLYKDPQKCIKILSNKSFLNNIFQPQLLQLIEILEQNLRKMNKQNKNISFSELNQQQRSKQVNFQLIVCLYSIIIMKSIKKVNAQSTIFDAKLALETLTKIYKQAKEQQIKKVVAALLLKIPNFTNHKNIVKDLDPHFISTRTLQKSQSIFRTQCPNLFEQKLMKYKHTQWSKFLSYKQFRLDFFSQCMKKLQSTDNNSNDASGLLHLREQLKGEFEYLIKRIKLIEKEEFYIFQFCEKFMELFRLKLQFSKTPTTQKFISKDSKNPSTSSKSIANYNLNQLKLKILLQGRNYLLNILISLIKKLSTYWIRKIKWLYDFIIERVQIFGLEEMGALSIQQPEIYIEKLTQLRLIIKLCHIYYKEFGEGLFSSEKLKSILFTGQYSFYKMIEAILYNQYQFRWQSESNRIVNYQKNKKVTEQSKNKQNLIKMVNINSKSLNIHPHYDFVFQKVIHEIAQKQGVAYPWLQDLIVQALRFIYDYYKNSQTYFYGGNLISMIQNCKNTEIIKHKILDILKDIKATLYPNKKMVKQGLQYFCQQVFQSYISKKRITQQQQVKNKARSFNICKTAYLSIHPTQNDDYQQDSFNYNPRLKVEPSPQEQNKGIIRKTKSYDMVIEGWTQQAPQSNHKPSSASIKNQENKLNQESQIFYSIRQCSVKDEISSNLNEKNSKISIQNVNEKFQSIKENESPENEQNFILTPEF